MKYLLIFMLFISSICFSQYTADYTILREKTDTIYSTNLVTTIQDSIELSITKNFSINKFIVSCEFHDTTDSSHYFIDSLLITVDDSLSNVIQSDNNICVSNLDYFLFSFSGVSKEFELLKKYLPFGNNKYLVLRYRVRLPSLLPESVYVKINTLITGTYNY